MPDPTPPPVSIGIEEQIEWAEQVVAECGTGEGAWVPAMYHAILATLRRVPALERLHALCAAAKRFDTGLQVDPKAFDDVMKELDP